MSGDRLPPKRFACPECEQPARRENRHECSHPDCSWIACPCGATYDMYQPDHHTRSET